LTSELNGFTVYSEAVFAASDARATVLDVAAVIPMANRCDKTVKKLDTVDVDDFDFLLLLLELALGIARADAGRVTELESRC
jgi:hypothetical protein